MLYDNGEIPDDIDEGEAWEDGDEREYGLAIQTISPETDLEDPDDRFDRQLYLQKKATIKF